MVVYDILTWLTQTFSCMLESLFTFDGDIHQTFIQKGKTINVCLPDAKNNTTKLLYYFVFVFLEKHSSDYLQYLN